MINPQALTELYKNLPWMYSLLREEPTGTHYLRVVCGSTFLYEVFLQLTDAEVAAVLPLSRINEEFFAELRRMEPFGPGNPNPVFASQRLVAVPHSARIVGQGHLKLRLASADAQGPAVDAIGFGLADYLPEIEQGRPFSACYTIELNEYRGQRSVQLRLLDVRWE